MVGAQPDSHPDTVALSITVPFSFTQPVAIADARRKSVAFT
jgi:hypothetical protein